MRAIRWSQRCCRPAATMTAASARSLSVWPTRIPMSSTRTASALSVSITVSPSIAAAATPTVATKRADDGLALNSARPGVGWPPRRQMSGDGPDIMDRHRMRLGDAVRARHARGRFIGEVHRLFRHWREIIEDALYVRQALDDVDGECHGC